MQHVRSHSITASVPVYVVNGFPAKKRDIPASEAVYRSAYNEINGYLPISDFIWVLTTCRNTMGDFTAPINMSMSMDSAGLWRLQATHWTTFVRIQN